LAALLDQSSAAAGPLEDGTAVFERSDYATAVGLWRPLAEQGLAAAQYSLGMMYAYGQGGLRRELVQAYMWLNIAASRYPPTQGTARPKALAARDAFAAEMNGGQIAKAQKLSGAWVRRVQNPA
jgi:hypothetical protein